MDLREQLLRVTAYMAENILQGTRTAIREDLRYPTEYPTHRAGNLRDDLDRIYIEKNADGSYTIADNYEASPGILTLSRSGQWSIRGMHSERPAKPISQDQAEANAKLFFYDARVEGMSKTAKAIAVKIVDKALR